MSREALRGGLVGCGYFALNHLHAWQDVRGADIVALCDRRLERAREHAARFGVAAVHDDLARMLQEERLDFVDIVTTPDTHRNLVERAAARGVHVVCQKPMAPAMEDARAMVAACRRAGVRFMVHENFRWQLPMRAVKEGSARIGPLHFARISFHTGFDVYARQPYLATDPRLIIYDLGVHLLDLARFFTGEIEELYCQTRRVNPRVRGEDLATILLRSRSGANVVVELSFGSKPLDEHFPETLVHLEGKEGTVSLGPGYRLGITSPEGREERRVGAVPRAWLSPPAEVIQDSVVHTQAHWVECLRAGRDAETSGADNLRTLELVFGAYASAASGEPYRVKGEAGAPGTVP